MPVKILGSVPPQHQATITQGALKFVAILHRTFNGRRKELLQARMVRQSALEKGYVPTFLPETKWIRDDPTWKAAPPAPGMADRRIEITGPVDRKMVINALNAGTSTFMADFEDSTSPTWINILSGQTNLKDAVRGTIDFVAENGKYYKLQEKVATLIVRPRGWHMEEAHVLIDGERCSASLFDFGIYFYNNASELIARGKGPYFYCPKMESYLEARLWNDVFNVAQDLLEIPRGTIRATCLIETIMAAFEMEEIIYELREHSSGLNCGRWDYIFSFIKRFKHDPKFILPDRGDVGMTTPFMDAYVRLLIKTCHKRGVHAMGGMAAQIPIKDNAAANQAAMDKVRADKLREVQAGHDGTWVAHPALVPLAKEIFDKHMPTPNQIFKLREDVDVKPEDLISTKATGQITEKGVRLNLNIALQYMEAWLRGLGCVPIHNMMEDAATAEISRAQLYHWIRHQAKTVEGTLITSELVKKLLVEETVALKASGSKENKFDQAAKLLEGTIVGKEFAEFLTTLCYDSITSIRGSKL